MRLRQTDRSQEAPPAADPQLHGGELRRLAVDLRLVVGLLAVMWLVGCSTLPRTNAVPAGELNSASIPGIPNARYWVDENPLPFVEDVLGDVQRERAARAQAGKPGDVPPPAHILALSGGGEDGAFAVGLLRGWTAHGDRPPFRVVTGISAGALIAPFAFLGKEYDDALKEAIESIGHDGLFRSRGLMGLVSDGFSDNRPAMDFMARYVTPQMLQAIAAEYRKGRALMIGTTELDSGRAVTWNMGAIAASGAPDALDLFRKVLVASSSIPGAVSPVMIDVEANGQRYQEMHVDGGVSTQVFTYPANMLKMMEQLSHERYRGDIRVYVILNGKATPEWYATQPRVLDIGSRALQLLLQRQSVDDLDRIFRTAQQDGTDYNLAFIGSDFLHPEHKRFDAAYMSALMDYGYRLGAAGYPWHKAAP
jgi:hypothetical protein